jgi:hypothetical protein
VISGYSLHMRQRWAVSIWTRTDFCPFGVPKRVWRRYRWPSRTKLNQRGVTEDGPFCYRLVVLPELNADGELPAGVHIVGWDEFESRFGVSSRDVYGFSAGCGP